MPISQTVRVVQVGNRQKLPGKHRYVPEELETEAKDPLSEGAVCDTCSRTLQH